MSEELIKKIDEITKLNQEYRRDMNEKLNHIRGGLTKKTEDVEEAYNRGLNDAWELARKMTYLPSEGGYEYKEMVAIFGRSCVNDVFKGFTCVEAMDRVKKYEEQQKKKEEQEKEAQTFERGDVVKYNCGDEIKEAIFLGETEEYYWAISDNDTVPQKLYKYHFTLTKTGKYAVIKSEW